MEFGLPLTGLDKFEETIGLPDFNGPVTDEDYISNQATHFQENFAAQIVLHRLSANVHSVLNKSRPNHSQFPSNMSNLPQHSAQTYLCPFQGLGTSTVPRALVVRPL